MITAFKNCLLKKAKYLNLAALLFLFLASSSEGIAQISIFLETQNPKCGGFATGYIKATVTGGVSPYSYLWNNGATEHSIYNVPAGAYSITVTDALGITAEASAILTEPTPLETSIVVTKCTLPGSLEAVVVGGVPPYTYEWSNGKNTAEIVNLQPGSYCVTIFDSNDCGYITCKQISSELVALMATVPASCGDGQGGTATVSTTGGNSPFTFLWSNGSTTQTIQGLPPGSYSVTVTSNNGCTTSTEGYVGLISGSLPVSLGVNPPVCAGESDGSITVNSGNGVPPLSYLWSNGEATQTISDLDAGTYSVTVTDALGCTGTKSATLSYQSNLSVTTTSVNPTCSNSSNGSVGANPAGGVPPYTYLWSNGGTTSTMNNLPAGNYEVTVTDSLGCIVVKSAILTAPPAMAVSVSATSVTECGATNGSVSASPTGSQPPYSYIWNNGGTSNIQNNIPAGNYSVTVTSSQGCTATGSGTVAQPPFFSISVSGSTAVCPESNNGSLTAIPPTGAGPYTYHWSNGASTKTIGNLGAGTYSVTVNNATGCEGTAVAEIQENPEVFVSIVAIDIKCHGASTGELKANPFGGTPPYSYLWSNGDTTAEITGLASDTYTLTLSDALGCTRAESASIGEPAALNIFITGSGGSCGDNGELTASPNGGTGPYFWLWSNGATTKTITGLTPGQYSVTVVDANSCSNSMTTVLEQYPEMEINLTAYNTTCNGSTDGFVTTNIVNGSEPFQYLWSNNAVTSSISGLSPGQYSVTVTDKLGCTGSGSATVSLGTGLNMLITSTGYICPGEEGFAVVQALGGNPPYTWEWSNGQNADSIVFTSVGTYSVTATDVSGCFGEASIFIENAPPLFIDEIVDQVSCNGLSDGSISLSIEGGVSPYQYLWEDGSTQSLLENIAAGSYLVTVTDNAGCINTKSIVLSEPEQLDVVLSATPAGCNDNGTATPAVSGGVPPYVYHWSTGDTASTLSGLASGDYSISLSDANGCESTASVSIPSPPAVSCEISLLQPVSKSNGDDGALSVSAYGGTPAFNFLWSNGQTQETNSGLSPGEYSVTVSDSYQCSSVCTLKLLNPGVVGDFVWEDLNEDGLQDEAEPGLSEIVVAITGMDEYGRSINKTTQTDLLGNYRFDVQPGNYRIYFDRPGGYFFSPAKTGNDDSIDSDADELTGSTELFTLLEGDENLLKDAGFILAHDCDSLTFAGSICCDQSLCSFENPILPITESAPPAGGSGGLVFQWFFTADSNLSNPANWAPIPGAKAATYSPANLVQTTYFRRGARRESCPDFQYSNIVAIDYDTLPQAKIIGPELVCPNSPAEFASSVLLEGAEYEWFFEDGVPSYSSSPTVEDIRWDSEGDQTVILKISWSGCASSDTLVVKVSNEAGDCAPILRIEAQKEGQQAASVRWSYPKQSGVEQNFSVEWAWENGSFSTLGIADSVVENNGIGRYLYFHDHPKKDKNLYRVKLEDSNGLVIYSNIEELIFIDSVNLVAIFPNPVTDILHVEIFDRFEAQITFHLIAADGKMVGNYKASQNDSSMEIDLKDIPAGVYFFRVNYDGKIQKIFKVLKQGS